MTDIQRVAMLSVHTCPLAMLGGKETGGMNVYVRELTTELDRRGIAVDVFFSELLILRIFLILCCEVFVDSLVRVPRLLNLGVLGLIPHFPVSFAVWEATDLLCRKQACQQTMILTQVT